MTVEGLLSGDVDAGGERREESRGVMAIGTDVPNGEHASMASGSGVERSVSSSGGGDGMYLLMLLRRKWPASLLAAKPHVVAAGSEDATGTCGAIVAAGLPFIRRELCAKEEPKGFVKAESVVAGAGI